MIYLDSFLLLSSYIHPPTQPLTRCLRATVLLALREGLSKEQRIVVPPTAFESNTQSAEEHCHSKPQLIVAKDVSNPCHLRLDCANHHTNNLETTTSPPQTSQKPTA